jgi:hypothetical protein
MKYTINAKTKTIKTMISENLDPQVKVLLKEFTEDIKQRAGANLISIMLYGGAAKNDYKAGKSNTNMLFVFDHVDLIVLDALSVPFQKAMLDFQMTPFILTSSEIVPSSNVFAGKLFDIQKHHTLLYGKDVVSHLQFDEKHLQFIAEQELRNQLSRMKYFYIQNFNLPEQLFSRVQKGFTTLVINANTFLYLKHKAYYATRQEITEHILKEPEMDAEALRYLLKIKNGEAKLSFEEIKAAYDLLMIQYNQLIKAIKQI